MNEALKDNITNEKNNELNSISESELISEEKEWKFVENNVAENSSIEIENQKQVIENTNIDNSQLIETEETEVSNLADCTALITIKEHRLMAARSMFKKSIRVSLKSFLISLSLSFLNLFT